MGYLESHFMSNMFRDAHKFNGNLSAWDASKVTDMSYMFYDAHKFNGDLSAWDTSKVTSMSPMLKSKHMNSTAICRHGIPRKSLLCIECLVWRRN